jgi:anaerobic magnesium-protoporphyrin IX monomethyl ester cyclase
MIRLVAMLRSDHSTRSVARAAGGEERWIGLVGPEVEENLSLRYLAGSLQRAGHRPRILAFNGERDFPRILAEILDAERTPLLVGLSLAFQHRAQDFLALAMALRERGFRGHLTAGGHFATFETEALLRNFPELDSICRFEAEATIVELASALAADQQLDGIAGLAFRRAGRVVFAVPRPLPELDSLPWPDRGGEPARCFGHPVIPVVGSRGCYGHCRYCCIAAWHSANGQGRRFRLRAVDDLADEMAEQQRTRGVDIFVFHDDNFFLPRPTASLERINALADALAARGVRRFATAVKARPDDVDHEVFAALVERLHCIRAYVGFESDTPGGLATLGRGSQPEHNRRALEVIRGLGLYIGFNLLVFDPDTLLDGIAGNVAFMRSAADYPFCVGRVELYAGTPLLAGMLQQGRCQGDFLRRDYRLASPEVERAFHLFMGSMAARNFGDDSSVLRLSILRFEIEACRFFHPTVYRSEWRERAVAITRRLSLHTADVLDAIVRRCASEKPMTGDAAVAAELESACRQLDEQVVADAQALATEMGTAVGPTALGDGWHARGSLVGFPTSASGT